VTSLGRADHIDAVAVDLPAGTTATASCLQQLADPPAWIRTLMRARDALVRPFGLKTQTGTANVPVLRCCRVSVRAVSRAVGHIR